MKKIFALLLAFSLGLICFSACAVSDPPASGNTPPPIGSNQPTLPSPPAGNEVAPPPVHIDHLTFEMVVSWEDSNRLLAEMKDLARSLRDALQNENCQVDNVTITISTTAGPTGDALEKGGVDLAFMPAVDYVACSDAVSAVLTTDEDPCTTVLAVSGVREELDEAFRSALTNALLTSDAGKDFLDIYQDSITWVPATEESIQAVRDYVAAQEATTLGGK